MNGRDLAHAVHLVAAYLDQGHAGKGVHLRGIVLNEVLHCRSRRGVFVAGAAAGKRYRRCHALEIPLEGTADGFVEVVDVKNEAAVGRGKGAEVAHVRVAAELRDDAGIRQQGQIGSHDRDGATKVAEGRRGHQLILQLDERGNAAVHGAGEKIERRCLASLGVECVVLLAADLLAPRLAQIASFFRSCPVHDPQPIP